MHARAPSSVAATFAAAATFFFAAAIVVTADTKPRRRGPSPSFPRERGGHAPGPRNGREHRPRSPVAASDGETARGDGGRSLALVQADPSAGQTFREASNGVNLNFLCDFDAKWYSSFYTNLKFCNYQDEIMSFVILPWQVTNVNTTHTGFLDDCPRTKEECHDLGLASLSLESCLENCGNAALFGNTCYEEDGCELNTFCKRMPGEDEGICSACPSSPEECLAESVGTRASKKSCASCEPRCDYHYWGDFTVDGDVIWAYGITGSGLPTATGSVVAPLVDCSNLALKTVDNCPDAKDSICLIHNDYLDETCSGSSVRDLAKKCENSGGLAMAIYYSSPCSPDDIPGYQGAWTISPVNIPLIRISYNSGVALKQKLGSLANVTTYLAITDCWRDQFCSTKVPCMDEGKYCLFDEGRDQGMHCQVCPEDPLECLLPTVDTRLGALFTGNGAQACVQSCAANIKFDFGKSCKTCGDSTMMTEFFDTEDTSEKCLFCPEEDVVYPDRPFPLFSIGKSEITCRQVNDFFNTVAVSKDSKNCKLAKLQNYICGCQGTGYAGANTQAKRNALVWVPRVMAILSGLGSSFVLFDCMKTRTNRNKLFHQLMAQMSLFDIIGSVAFAFTSLPMPSDTYIIGASGNEATCTAQGFFIQAGTVACFTNVSLAFYYFFVIQKGWSETRLKKVRVWFFVCPVIVGMAFSFAGIPFYDNMQLWCNNAASWWPDIPVAVAICISTVVMASVCWDVRKKANASSRWRQGGGESTGNSLSTKVFWQSFWYLMSFYMTWPPYLALQYSWASGKEYDNYGFILYAGMVVPLQGVWNFFVYARNRQLKRARQYISSLPQALSQLSRSNNSRRPTDNEDTAIAAQPISALSVEVSVARDHNYVEDGPNGTSLNRFVPRAGSHKTVTVDH